MPATPRAMVLDVGLDKSQQNVNVLVDDKVRQQYSTDDEDNDDDDDDDYGDNDDTYKYYHDRDDDNVWEDVQENKPKRMITAYCKDWFCRFCHEGLSDKILVIREGLQNKLKAAYTFFNKKIFMREELNKFSFVVLDDMAISITDFCLYMLRVGRRLRKQLQQAEEKIGQVQGGDKIFNPKERAAFCVRLWRVMEQVSMLEYGFLIILDLLDKVSLQAKRHHKGRKGNTRINESKHDSFLHLIHWIAGFVEMGKARFPVEEQLFNSLAFQESEVCEVLTRQILGQATGRLIRRFMSNLTYDEEILVARFSFFDYP
jgi:hypothetical protein